MKEQLLTLLELTGQHQVGTIVPDGGPHRDHGTAISTTLRSGLVPPSLAAALVERAIERAIERVVKGHGFLYRPHWEEWATNWRSGVDRSREEAVDVSWWLKEDAKERPDRPYATRRAAAWHVVDAAYQLNLAAHLALDQQDDPGHIERALANARTSICLSTVAAAEVLSGDREYVHYKAYGRETQQQYDDLKQLIGELP